jgi:hypothetical protein
MKSLAAATVAILVNARSFTSRSSKVANKRSDRPRASGE